MNYAFTNGKILDGTKDMQVQTGLCILVQDGTITDIVPDTADLSGYKTIDLQGRYIMPALYPAMYFVTAGWNRLLERFVKKENIRMWIYRVLTALLAASPFLCYIFLVVPFYG